MNQSNMTIRLANEADLDSLSKISSITFRDSYAHLNTTEDVDSYVNSAFNKEKLRYEMNHAGSQFWLASQEGETVGYLKVNFGDAQSDLNDNAALEVERIYVLEQFQGNKIGFALMKKAYEIAVDADLNYIWLGVWEKNEKAIRFYNRVGFKNMGEHTFMLGTDPQKDVLMRLDLEGSAIENRLKLKGVSEKF